MKKTNNPYLIRSNQKDIHESLEKIVTKHLNTEFMPIPEHQIEIFNIIDDIVTRIKAYNSRFWLNCKLSLRKI